MSWLPYLIVLAVLVLVQRPLRRTMGTAMAVGDEHGYIRCGSRDDPYCPEQFLRVPLLAWLSKQAHHRSTNPERLLRSATSAASTLTILTSMLSAQVVGGFQAALGLGLLLVLMPGRFVLSHHIWPDIWLGLWLSLACLIMVYPDLPANLRMPLLGIIAALAFMTRFDALLLAPFAGFALAPLTGWDWVLVLSPTLLVFTYLSIHNARRYQIPWPDTTWMFNLIITANEADRQQGVAIRVEHQVQKAIGVWSKLGSAERFGSSVASLRGLVRRPTQALGGMLLRLWASLGPDSFVLHRLLPPGGQAYPDISSRFNTALHIALNHAFPIFAAATILALLVAQSPALAFLWPTLALAVASLIHNRTRYRQAWLPGAALLLVAAASEPGFWPRLLSAQSALEWVACIALFLALIFIRVRPDTPVNP